MSLQTNLQSVLTQIATDWKNQQAINGNLASLSTTQKTNLVGAINEVFAAVGGAGASIVDTGTSTVSVWSSSKTNAEIAAAVAALLDTAPGTLDTLNELAAALGDDPAFATTIAGLVGTAQSAADAAQGTANTAVTNAATADGKAVTAQDGVNTLNTNLGTITTDFLAVYNAAKA